MAVAALFFANGFGFGTFVAHLPLFKARLGLSDGLLGMALLGAAVASLISMPVVGVLIGRYGSRRICVVVTLAACGSLVFPFLAPVYPAFVAATVAIGAVYSAFDVAMNAQAVSVESALGRPIMSSFHAAFSFGGLMGSAAAAVLIARRVPLAFSGAFTATACSAIAIVAVTRLIADRQAADRREARGEVRGAPRRVVVLLGVLAFLGLVGEGAMADWTGVYLRSSLALAAAASAAGFGAFSIAMAIGRAAGDRVVAAFGPRGTLVGGAAFASLALAAALLLHTAWAAYLGFAAVGLGLANVIPVVFSAAGRAPGLRPGVGIAAVSTIGYIGFVVGPPVIGFTSDATGLRLALGLVVACIATIAFVAPIAVPALPERDFRA